eukprot:SAG31_NODE_277_length_18641_cov_21.357944_13_plen_83_part_00
MYLHTIIVHICHEACAHTAATRVREARGCAVMRTWQLSVEDVMLERSADPRQPGRPLAWREVGHVSIIDAGVAVFRVRRGHQ